ncbi:MAG: hypothetical protein R3B72_39700 [Polyangiaceae bacterium]
MRTRAMIAFVAACLTPSLAWAPPVLAAPDDAPEDEPVTRAIALGRQGKEAFDAQRFEEAREAFDAAEAITHSPVFLLYRGRAELALGQLKAARASFEQVAEERLGEDATPQWRDAVGEARDELEALEERLPKVVTPAPEVAAPAPLAPVAPQPVVPLAQPVPLEDEVDWAIPGYSLLGAGGAALVVGGILGGLALGAAADAREACGRDGICDGDTSKRDHSERLAHASTATLVMGGVASLLGGVFLVIPLVTPEDHGELSLTLDPTGFRGRF